MFYNGFEFKQDLIPLLKYFYIKPVLTSVKNPQGNATVEGVHQLILYMLVTKDLDNKVFDYMNQWVENLSYIEISIRASCHRTIMATSGQAVFDRDMLFRLTSIVD